MMDGEPMYPCNVTTPRAVKAHKCGECRRTIQPGEQYEVTSGAYDGNWETYKTCQHCLSVRKWLSKVCNGWIFTMVGEDLLEHFREGYGLWLGRAYIGIKKGWKRRDGSPMKPMALPEKLPAPEYH